MAWMYRLTDERNHESDFRAWGHEHTDTSFLVISGKGVTEDTFFTTQHKIWWIPLGVFCGHVI